MDNQSGVTPLPSPNQLGVLFSEIAKQSMILREMLLEHPAGEESDTFHALQSLVEKIGYIADLGAEKTGEPQMRGGAVDWFLPPAYHWEAQELPAGEAVAES